MSDELARIRMLGDVCPGCGATITYTESNGGRTMDVTHPQPPCERFRAFCERLLERRYPSACSSSGTLV